MADRSEEARLRAESNFKKKERHAQEVHKVWAEHAAAGKAADTNRARLKGLRLAKDAADTEAAAKLPTSKPPRKGRSKLGT
jgi:hypothetical protein